MNIKTVVVDRFLLRAHPFRAWLEMLGVGIALLVVLFPLMQGVAQGTRQNGAFIAILTAVSLFALRVRVPGGPWWRQILFETLVGAELGMLLSGALLLLSLGIENTFFPPDQAGLMQIVIFVLNLRTALEDQAATGSALPLLSFVTIFSCAVAYFTMRFGARLWLFWERLRRRHLIWSITHSHLMLVVVGVILLAGLIVLNWMQYITADQPETAPLPIVALLNLVPIFIVLGVLTVMLLIIVLPPSVVVSYFAARRTTRRLKTLASAVSAFRAGDYAARVQTQGEDEVAQLQTDFNAMAADLERAMRDLQAERDAVAGLLQARRELVAGVSHELRTPIAVLRGYLESTLDRSDSGLPPDLRRDLDVMERETAHLQRLIDDLFSLSRAEAGRLELRRQPTDVAAAIRRTVESAAPVLWKTGRVELVADLPAELPAALVDEGRFEQILLNLLRNGVNHTPPGGIVAVSACAGESMICIQVRDTGEGIAPDDLPRIWERFYRAENARPHDGNGAGLGLALVKELAEAMGGSVAVESAVGQGSCFTVRLPIAQSATPANL